MWQFILFLYVGTISFNEAFANTECLQENKQYTDAAFVPRFNYLMKSSIKCDYTCFVHTVKPINISQFVFTQYQIKHTILDEKQCKKNNPSSSIFTCTGELAGYNLGKDEDGELNIVKIAPDYHIQYLLDNGYEKLEVYSSNPLKGLESIDIGACGKTFKRLYDCNAKELCKSVTPTSISKRSKKRKHH